ncbi:hypothetical protein ACV980_008660 [Bacillus safensis]
MYIEGKKKQEHRPICHAYDEIRSDSKAGDCMYPRVYGGFHGGGFTGGGAHIGPVGSHIGFGGYYLSPGVFSGLGGFPGYGGFGTFSGYPYGSTFIMGRPPGFYVRSY